MRKAVFFDRDGVLNVDKSYLGFIKDFEWMDGAKEALAYLTRQGYAIIVVTNQSGVARGYYTEDDVKVLHDWMCQEAAKAGGIITAVYYCPYLEGAPVKAYDKKSDWRKPAPGMVLQAAKDYDIDASDAPHPPDGAGRRHWSSTACSRASRPARRSSFCACTGMNRLPFSSTSRFAKANGVFPVFPICLRILSSVNG